MDLELTPVSSADEANSFEEYNGVVEALTLYIDAAKTGDGDHMRPAFYNHAKIVGSMSGSCVELDADAFAEAVKSGGASPEVQHHIAWIDISGPAAAAKIEFINWGGFRFTDFFVLYKDDDGKWKISGKVFNSHSKN